jgi:NAD(P)-dependent dehydrogenase (short-subunit alcohol dehydrogenase family)
MSTLLAGRHLAVVGTWPLLLEPLARAAAAAAAQVEVVWLDPDAPDPEQAVDAALDGALDGGPLPDTVLVVSRLAAPSGAQCAKLSIPAWSATLAGGLTLPFLVARRLATEWLIAGQGGRLVFAQLHAPAPDAAERAVRSGLAGFVRSVSRELASRAIRANGASLAVPDADPSALAALAAPTLLFLASDEASFVDGEVWPIDLASGVMWPRPASRGSPGPRPTRWEARP